MLHYAHHRRRAPRSARALRSGALVIAVASALVAQGCGLLFGFATSTRRVLIDFKHDQFAASFLSYFPNTVKVHPGDTVEFRQFWSGEPHTVTMGTLVDTLGKPYWDMLDAARRGDEIDTSAPPSAPGFEALPVMFDLSTLELYQAGAQPCYRDTWVPERSEPDEACPQRPQPKFNGRQTYYSSGFIPYEGKGSNSFTLPLSDDILPGTYRYYCNVHGPAMSGAVEVVPKKEAIPSQAEVTRQAAGEAKSYTDTLATVLARQHAGQDQPLPVVGGSPKPEEVDQPALFMAMSDEFVPSTVEARAGEKVTWTFYRGHTLSFNVPRYFPVFTRREDGRITYNDQAIKPVRWPGRPRPEGGGPEPGGPGAVLEPVNVDAGEFDGTGGLHSTGWDYLDGDTFSVTFTRPGTYPFACLLHPAMVGKVVVK